MERDIYTESVGLYGKSSDGSNSHKCWEVGEATVVSIIIGTWGLEAGVGHPGRSRLWVDRSRLVYIQPADAELPFRLLGTTLPNSMSLGCACPPER